ncbi:hypothetical protein EHW97_13795 [Aeromicrobium camelliae]|uniref:Uncharacterized protein n=1 Tax=Aeromicrobium camelliae TaxID=1538144 RepID=A0A3N6WLX2_9ACTN|nr:hypothetical protein [Aeromicrobium camelliae]RQN02323.1 hypothetical protein EHW97_13795 [Aeromicrobium camelliae]
MHEGDDTMAENQDDARAVSPRHVDVRVMIEAASQEEARALLRSLLRDATGADTGEAGPGSREGGARVRGWSITEPTRELWDSLSEGGIPEILTEMFPPEPDPTDYRTPGGALDEEAYDEACEQWRDQCLSLAVTAARLPDLLERVERAERVRDGLLDVMERHALPPHPDVLELRDQQGRPDVAAYRAAVHDWEQECLTTLLMQNEALEQLGQEGGPRTAYLPAQFHQEWLPADLLALTALRELLEQPSAFTGRLLGREQREELAAMLFAADPEVSISDPDTPGGMPIYEGQASDAHKWIIPGVYQATGMDGQGEFRVVVGRSPIGNTGTASAAFPPAEHDSTVLNQIARALEEAAEVDPDDDFHWEIPDDGLRELVERIDTLVTATGRTAADGGTLIERGSLLSDLLARREQSLHPDQDRPDPGPRHGDTDLSR